MEDSSAEKVISEDTKSVSAFVASKFAREAHKMWDTFYRNNRANFFKDRHYLFREFPELSSCQTIREIGCGVGNTIFPMIENGCDSMFQACDFSEVAVQLLREHPLFSPERIQTNVCDITQYPPFESQTDCVFLMFVLSAIDPDHHRQAVANAIHNLKPGGFVMFRDYGRLDEAQLRLARKGGKKIKDNFYLKQDGTRVYYFTLEDLEQLFSPLQSVQNEYHTRVITNHQLGSNMNRVWVQAKFFKPFE